MRKTKIVATLGSNNADILEMINLGVNVFRINLSYTSREECE